MRYKRFLLVNLGILLSCCTTLSSKPPEVIQNPSLPAIWTPTCCSTPDLSLPDDDDIEMQAATLDIDEEAASPLISSTGEAKEIPSSIPIFTGGEQWFVTIPGVSWPYIATTSDGGFLVLGLRADHNGDRHNILFRLDPQGAILWERILQPGHFFGVLGVGDGGMLLVFTQSLTKLDAEGNIEWIEYLSYDQDLSPFINSFYYFQSSQIQSNGQALMFDTYSINTFSYDGRFISQLASLSKEHDGQSSIWLTTQAKWTAGQEGRSGLWVRREGAYTSSWLRTFDFQDVGGGIQFREMQILGTRDGGAVFLASIPNLIRPASGIWIVRMDSEGNVLWQKGFEGEQAIDFVVQETSDNGFIIASSSRNWGTDVSGYYLRLLRVDASGNQVWDNFVGDGVWRVVPKMILNTRNRGHFIVGEVAASGDQLRSKAGDLFLIKIDQNGLVKECPWFQPTPSDLPLDKFPSSMIETVLKVPFSTAVIVPHLFEPQNLEIRDGFDQFSSICVFPTLEKPTPMPSPSTSFVATPGMVVHEDALHPIAIADGTLIGASQGGEWVESHQVVDAMLGVLQFQLYSFHGSDGEDGGVLRRPSDSGICPRYPTVEFYNQAGDSKIIALGAEWRAQPRSVNEIDPTVSIYQEILRDYLQDHGINDPDIQIDTIAKADLEGDGFEEVIISASWYNSGYLSRGVSIGDYSVVFLRQFVDGEIRTLTMIQKIHKSASGSIVPIRYQIAGILDLNGDGIMDILIRGQSGSGTEHLVIDPTHSLQVPVLQIDCATS